MKNCFFYILWTCIALNCFAVPFSGKADRSNLHERMYVQTDKSVYLAGEPVLMKLLTTDDENIPLVFSKVGYAELIRDSIAILQIKVELTNGTGSGQMVLPVNLPSGYYRLIAYTQFMRNEGASVFFEKTIAVINTFQSDYQPIENNSKSEPVISNDRETEASVISLNPNKATYTTRERGEMIINGLPENIYTLSVSIAGKEGISIPEPEKSNTAINEFPKQTDPFLPEYEGPIITGKIINNETGNPLPMNMETSKIKLSPVIAFPGDKIWFFSGKISETDHRVLFFTSGNPGTKEIATVLYNSGEKYHIEIQSPFVNRFKPKPLPALRVDSSCYDQLLSRSVALQVFRYFSKDSSEIQNISSSYLKIKPSSSYRLDDYTRYTTMAEVFTEIIINARFHKNSGKQELEVLIKRSSNYSYGYPLVLLDGVPISDHEAIYNYDPRLVERINIYDNSYVLGSFLFDGIIELKTYRGLHQNLNLNTSSKIIQYETPQAPYRFETPDYSNEKNRHSIMPDSRHTLLWNPDLRSDGQDTIRVPFDTSDLTGEFQATVEGITKDGKIVYATATFKVE